jgi:alkylglycerol monooxygenase
MILAPFAAIPAALAMTATLAGRANPGVRIALKVAFTLSCAAVATAASVWGPHPRLAAGVAAGLALCAGGDYALALPRTPQRFLTGLGFFAVGYLLYGIILWVHAQPRLALIAVAAVAAAAAVLQYLSFSRLPRALRGPVVAYMLVISFLVVTGSAVALATSASLLQRLLPIPAVLCIYASDTLIGRREFGRPLGLLERAIMPTYYAGQLCMVLLVCVA